MTENLKVGAGGRGTVTSHAANEAEDLMAKELGVSVRGRGSVVTPSHCLVHSIGSCVREKVTIDHWP